MDQIARANQLEAVLRRAECRAELAENARQTGLEIHTVTPSAAAPTACNKADLAACSLG